MIAKQLWPDRDDIGQCEAQREGRYLNDTPETNKRCAHSAKFVVDGKRLCQRHAGQAALRYLMGKTENEIVNAAIEDARYFERQRDDAMRRCPRCNHPFPDHWSGCGEVNGASK